MSGDETLKIAIAETSVIVRSGLALVLKRISGLKILPIEVVSPEALLDCIRIHRPDILIMNPAFPVFGDIRELKKEAGELHMKYIALLCALGDSAVLKNYDDTFSLYDDPTVLKEKLNKLLDVSSDAESDEGGQDVLSAREKEIVTCVVKGMTNKEIADTLFLSAHTVITHRRNIARKLQIHSPAGLTIYAIVNKLVKLQDIKEYL